MVLSHAVHRAPAAGPPGRPDHRHLSPQVHVPGDGKSTGVPERRGENAPPLVDQWQIHVGDHMIIERMVEYGCFLETWFLRNLGTPSQLWLVYWVYYYKWFIDDLGVPLIRETPICNVSNNGS